MYVPIQKILSRDPRWWWRIACFLLICLTILLLEVPLRANTLRTFGHGDLLPEISLTDLSSGARVTIKPGQGRPTAIFFFSINPEFRKKKALALLAELASLSGRLKGRVDVVGVYVEDKGKEIVTDYLKTIAVKIPVLHDEQRAVYNTYGVYMMPLVVLVATDGRLHEVVPYTYNVVEMIEGNLRLLLGEWTAEQLAESMRPKENVELSKEEKEYIRRVNYGRVMVSRKMYSQALREFSTAAQLMPKNPTAHIEAGFVQIKGEKWQEAEEDFAKALKLDPESDEAEGGLGLALYGRGNTAKALPHLEKAFAAPEPKLEVILALAEIAEQKGDLHKAIRLHKLACSRLQEMLNQQWQ